MCVFLPRVDAPGWFWFLWSGSGLGVDGPNPPRSPQSPASPWNPPTVRHRHERAPVREAAARPQVNTALSARFVRCVLPPTVVAAGEGRGEQTATAPAVLRVWAVSTCCGGNVSATVPCCPRVRDPAPPLSARPAAGQNSESLLNRDNMADSAEPAGSSLQMMTEYLLIIFRPSVSWCSNQQPQELTQDKRQREFKPSCVTQGLVWWNLVMYKTACYELKFSLN